MRYSTKAIPVEARHWEGPYGEVKYEELQAWGAPVVRDESDDLGVMLMTAGASLAVPKGAWIVRREPSDGGSGRLWVWQVFGDEEFRQHFQEDPEQDETYEDPFPGMQNVTLKRVAFYRPHVTAGMTTGHEWRHDGLTRAELREGGWTALYELSVPEEATA